MREPELLIVEESPWSRKRLENLALRYGIIASAIGCGFALIGISLGAVNFITPTHYPPLVLVLWLMLDAALVTLIFVQCVLYAIMLMKDESLLAIYSGIILSLFIGAVFELINKHFAPVSAECLFFLIGVIIVNGLVIIQRKNATAK